MKVVIVGAGQAGGWAAQTLRDAALPGEVVMIGDESHPPYQRPPLSKEVLLGEKPPESTYLWPAGLPFELVANTRVERIDRASKTLRVHSVRAIIRRRRCLCPWFAALPVLRQASQSPS